MRNMLLTKQCGWEHALGSYVLAMMGMQVNACLLEN